MFFLNKIEKRSHLIQAIIKIAIPFSIGIVLSIILIKQFNYTSKYAKEYDKLIALLIEAKKDKTIKVVYVNELSPPGMLTPLDIKDDYIKDPLKNILNLEFEIQVVK